VYAIQFLPSAARDLEKLEPIVRRRIARRIEQLARDPRGGGAVKLRGADDIWRARVGDYRILYQIEGERLIVVVIKIGHRGGVYRG
jgi:mRNA interferase RelE/StbE